MNLDTPTTDADQSAARLARPLGNDLVGQEVTVTYRGETGRTTITSSVTDVSTDGSEIELAAAPGHLFPRSSITALDGTPTIRPPERPHDPTEQHTWRFEDPRRDAAEHHYGRFWTFDDPTDF